jgi:hypothetical protein
MIKRAQIIHALAVKEQVELERLERCQRLSEVSEARLAVLWDKAFDLHVRPQAEPLFDYANQVGARMHARLLAQAVGDERRDQEQESR